MKNYRILILLYISLLVFACTNLDYQALQTRVSDNFSGKLSEPNNIDPSGNNQFSFAIMGDVHIGSDRGDIMEKAIDLSKNAGDSFIIFAGDITNNAESSEFSKFKEQVENKNMDYRVAIGNHDIYYQGWKHFKKFIGRSIYSFDADNVHITILDSANGSLGERQLNWLEDDLQSTNKAIKIVISHFPPWIGKFSNIFKMDSEEEAAILKNMLHENKVNYMFSAHYHGYEQAQLGFTKYIISGGVNRKLDPNEDSHFVRVIVNNNQVSTQYVEVP